MRRSCAGLILLVTLLSVPVRSQDDDDEDNSVATTTAQLFLRLDKQGAASVHLYLGQRPKAWGLIRSSLAETLGCPQDRFHSPSIRNREAAELNGWTEAEKRDYLRALADVHDQQLEADCGSVLQWDRLGRSGDIDLRNLSNALRGSGFRDFNVYAYVPLASRVELGPQPLPSQASIRDFRFAVYQIDLDHLRSPTISIFYGVSQRQLYGSVAVTLGFMLLPMSIALWMRRTALLLGRTDRTAAWFSYFRTISWTMQASMLLWIISGLGARQTLQEWASYAPIVGWRATLLDVAIGIGPAFLISALCLSLSYPLHRQLRGTAWTRREFMTQQLVTVGARAIPLMFLIASIETFVKDSGTAAVFFVLTLLSWAVMRTLQMHVSRSYPHALTTGELRDRVFAIANTAGVKISQIFVLPTGRSQLANAYAAGNQTVLFTDYLLQHLTKREVIAVAAHEVAHVRLGHVRKLGLALWGALVIPGLMGMAFGSSFDLLRLTGSGLTTRPFAIASWFWNWSQRDFVMTMGGLALFYLLSRRYEFEADALAVKLTGDAEAQITCLLKVGRLNLTPIKWGKATGSWLTHPSTVRRAERIADSVSIAPQQLQAILDRHRDEAQHGPASVPSEHYSVPEASDPENLVSAAIKQRRHHVNLWTLLLLHILPAALVAAYVRNLGISGNSAFYAYLAGVAATLILCDVGSAQLGLFGRSAQRNRIAQRLKREGAPIGKDSFAVGISPGALVRFYGQNYYNWDVGLLSLSEDRLFYFGEQVRFSLAKKEIESVCLGQSGPSWLKMQRVYVRFKQPDGRPFVFSLDNLEPCRIWNMREQSRQLIGRLQTFLDLPADSLPLGGLELPPLNVGEITSRAPQELGGMKINIQLFFFLFPMAVAVNALFGLDAFWYLMGTAFLTRVFQSIPFRLFRDRPLLFNTGSQEKAAAASTVN